MRVGLSIGPGGVPNSYPADSLNINRETGFEQQLFTLTNKGEKFLQMQTY